MESFEGMIENTDLVRNFATTFAIANKAMQVVRREEWKEEYPLLNQFIHAVLYTLSFSTLLFWIYFPFDLFLVNILLIQLPSILLTGSTLHGYLAGKMTTIK